jgi:hypothetical protein
MFLKSFRTLAWAGAACALQAAPALFVLVNQTDSAWTLGSATLKHLEAGSGFTVEGEGPGHWTSAGPERPAGGALGRVGPRATVKLSVETQVEPGDLGLSLTSPSGQWFPLTLVAPRVPAGGGPAAPATRFVISPEGLLSFLVLPGPVEDADEGPAGRKAAPRRRYSTAFGSASAPGSPVALLGEAARRPDPSSSPAKGVGNLNLWNASGSSWFLVAPKTSARCIVRFEGPSRPERVLYLPQGHPMRLELKAGEYVQVIPVQAEQAVWFQVRDALDRNPLGVHLKVDPTGASVLAGGPPGAQVRANAVVMGTENPWSFLLAGNGWGDLGGGATGP